MMAIDTTGAPQDAMSRILERILTNVLNYFVVLCAIGSLIVVDSCGEVSPSKPPPSIKPIAVVQKIPEEKAVSIAEEFVQANGYTDFVPLEGAPISTEGIDSADPAQRQSERFNSLKRHACGVIGRNVRSRNDGWTVVFCFNKEKYIKLKVYPQLAPMLESRGRPLVMEPDGSGVRVLHEDVLLNQPEMKRL
jgi:hypothetical protein